MARSLAARVLFVEGPDDKHVIGHLLMRRGLAEPSLPQCQPTGGKDGVLKAMKTAIPAGTGNSLGFVLDANDHPGDRWRAVASRLRSVGVAAPDELPSGGFVGSSSEFGVRVGVWLMPDNRRIGALEDFLQDLIDASDVLLPHARESTARAKAKGARFPDMDSKKALVHTWLAWQEEPGRPYGVAIKSRYLRDDSDAAERFVAWFGRVFGLTGELRQRS